MSFSFSMHMSKCWKSVQAFAGAARSSSICLDQGCLKFLCSFSKVKYITNKADVYFRSGECGPGASNPGLLEDRRLP